MYRRPSPLTQAHGLFLLRLLRNPFQVTERPLHHSSSPDPRLGFVRKELEELQSLKPFTNPQVQNPEDAAHVGGAKGRRGGEVHLEGVEISHPWPEWVEVMEIFVKKGYLDHYGIKKLSSPPTHSKDSNHIRTACLNFARDRFDFIRLFSRKDIQVIVGSGCPSLDRKVVNSGKRLRAHVGIEEGNVCCSCNLRGNCERAYVKAREDEGGRTVDVIRILLTYGLDFMTGSVENQPCLSRKVKESVRRLLKEIVEFSETKVDSNSQEAKSSGQVSNGQINVLMKQGDWICPTCNFINFAKNLKCLRCDGVCQEKMKKLREDREHLPLKKGDWICDKCNFLNFAKNTKCLQCNEKPPKRELNPGEWECESCNYINFRRNMVCLKCDWKRPKASNRGDSFVPFSFVRNGTDANQRHLHLESRAQNEEIDSWNGRDGFVDGDDSTFTKFKDFPMAGGKSAISQNLRQQQRWKGKMLISSRGPLRKQNSENSARYGGGLDESSDEDEMAGWFGY